MKLTQELKAVFSALPENTVVSTFQLQLASLDTLMYNLGFHRTQNNSYCSENGRSFISFSNAVLTHNTTRMDTLLEKVYLRRNKKTIETTKHLVKFNVLS